MSNSTKIETTVLDNAKRLRDLAGNSYRFWTKRDTFIDLVMMSFIAGEHGVAFARPGTAKSEIIHAVSQALGLRYYFGQGHAGNTYEELLGMQSFAALKQDKFDRVWRGLATCDIAFFDEFGNATPEVQNMLLSAMQERKVPDDGAGRNIPLRTLWTATNYPIESEAANDRFLFRMIMPKITDADEFNDLLLSSRNRDANGDVELAKTPITRDELLAMRRAVVAIAKDAGDDFRSAMVELWSACQAELPSEYISERRWVKLQYAASAHALYGGRTTVSRYDLTVAKYVLWLYPDPELFETLSTIVDRIALAGMENFQKANELLRDLEDDFRNLADRWANEAEDVAMQVTAAFNRQANELRRFIDASRKSTPEHDWTALAKALTQLKTQADHSWQMYLDNAK